MLVLFETAAGYALFQVLDEGKLESPEDLWKAFKTPESAKEIIKLKSFKKFESMSLAISEINDLVEGKLSDDLTSFLQETTSQASAANEKLIVADQKLGATISKKLGIQVISDKIIIDLYRGIREQLSSLITGMDLDAITSMSLGLSHSLSRHKLKFSADKVDTMIIQAIGLLDDLDKELNTYAMRVKEWYGWHFPEMSKIVTDNLAYAKVVKIMGTRANANKTDLSEILPEDLEKEVKDAAEISMGTEISDEDINNIMMGCDQVISLTDYRAELYEYLRNRMMAIAPNLTTLVGELVGARLISHAGSLVNLAKHPASTVQILGAEKALFRALKTKSPTPKYGLIYHASLVGQASQKNKGKIARLLATKSAISVRYDALAEEKDITAELGHNCRNALEKRIRLLERGAGPGRKYDHKQEKVEIVSTAPSYNTAADAVKMNTEESDESDDEEDERSSAMDVDKEDVAVVKSSKKDKKGKESEKQETEAGPSKSGDEESEQSEDEEKGKKEKEKEKKEKKEKGKKKEKEEKGKEKKEKKEKEKEKKKEKGKGKEKEIEEEKKAKEAKKEKGVEIKKEKGVEIGKEKKVEKEKEKEKKKKKSEKKESSDKDQSQIEAETPERSKSDKKKKSAEKQGEVVASSSKETENEPSKIKSSKKRKSKELEGDEQSEAVSLKKVRSESEPSKIKSKKHKTKELGNDDDKKQSEVVASSSKAQSITIGSESSKAKSSKKRGSEESGDSMERTSEPKPKKAKKSKVEVDSLTKTEKEKKKSDKKKQKETSLAEETIGESTKSKEKKESKKKKTPK